MSDLCPVCATPDATQLDDERAVPLLMNRLYDTAVEAKAAAMGEMALRGCRNCGFVWNRAFDGGKISYDAAYENDQTHSEAFSAHVTDRVRDLIAAVPAGQPIDFLEIGCGQGGFIAEVAHSAGHRLRSAEGFDPAFRGEDGTGPAGARIHRCYFTSQTADRLEFASNIVASRHTIEHVPDPVAFLTTIRTALGPASKARIFVETPCVDWIFGNLAMQDFFYEHCSLFTVAAMRLALDKAGFTGISIGHVFGGQYLWATALAGGHAVEANIYDPVIAAPQLYETRRKYIKHWRDQLCLATSPLAIWGAGAKGVNFALMMDAQATNIDHVIDINPAKQGRFLAGSGLPVLSPEDSAHRNPKTIYIMNPNYFDEIRSKSAAAGLDAELVAIN